MKVVLFLLIVLWAALGWLRERGQQHLHLMQQEAIKYYAARQSAPSDSSDMPPPAMWDARQKRMVPVPEGAYSYRVMQDSTSGMTMRAAEISRDALGADPLHLGLLVRLALIPSLWFHGMLAALTLGVAGLAFRT